MIFALIILTMGAFSYLQFTGNVIDDFAPENIGPSAKDQQCMQECVAVGCEESDTECMTANSEMCGQQCGVETTAPTPKDESEACMQKCVVKDCEKYDFNCQNQYKESCEKECGMVGEPEAKSEEEQCIRDCVAKVDLNIMCESGKSAGAGEQGNEICQKCAEECVHLYAGPCLSDEELTEKENACKTCEHCYGEPMMGDSGEGYECIVDIKCADASEEFGNESGIGPGIAKAVGNVFEKITDFFKGLFSSGDKEAEIEEEIEVEEETEIEVGTN